MLWCACVADLSVGWRGISVPSVERGSAVGFALKAFPFEWNRNVSMLRIDSACIYICSRSTVY